MYKEFETRTSYKYLREVIANLKEPICILGGWAVFLHANQKFQKAQGRPYLGSRDIDLGFNMSGDLRQSVLAQTISILTEKLNFKPLSFRFVKEIHTETEEEIDDGNMIPAHFVFPMCVDLIVDSIPLGFKKVFGFVPIDEPLLKAVFDRKEFVILKEFEKKLLLPKPEILLAMKINSLPDRDKEHKRVKDLCDIFALAWYSDVKLEEINLSKYIPESIIKKCLKSVEDDDFQRAAAQLGHDKEEVRNVFEAILTRQERK